MTQSKLISFVIPAYNASKYIRKTLENILSQTCLDLEIIIVDDGSTDGTFEIAKNFLLSSKFQDFKVIRKENGGVSSARNRGLIEATGEYVIFLDADDYVEKDLVELIKKSTEKAHFDAIFWKYVNILENEKTINRINYPVELQIYNEFKSKELIKLFLRGDDYLFRIDSIAFSRKFLVDEKLCFDEKHHYGEDQEFVYRAILKMKNILFIPEELTYWLHHKNSATKKANLRHFDAYYSLMNVSEEITSWIDCAKESSELSYLAKKRAIYAFLSSVARTSQCFRTYSSWKKALKELYPDILNEAIETAKQIKAFEKGQKLLKKLALTVFKFSPCLYFYLSKVLWKIRMIVRKI